jgi:hypothetical protein
MATTFTKFYPYARTLLGDTGRVNLYSNDQLDLAIRLGLLEEEDFEETNLTFASGDREIIPDVTDKVDIFRISVRAGLAMVRPTAGQNSYRTPVLSVSRGGGLDSLAVKLETMLNKLTGAKSDVDGDTDLDKWLTGMDAFINKMSGDLV